MASSVTPLSRCAGICVALLLVSAAGAYAQGPPATSTPVSVDEDVEPRIVGRKGTTLIGVSGFADRAFSTEKLMPFNYVVQADGVRFVTGHIAARLGVAGSGSLGGDEDDKAALLAGTGAPALRAFAGGMYFLRPKSMVSLYGAGEYWMQLTQRPEKDAGSILFKLGLQAAVSSRASLFAEGGYGFGLTRGTDDELVTRLSVQIGFRIRVR
jgi:hypothetical protein